MKSKSKILTLGVILTTVLSLAACGDNGGDGDAADGPSGDIKLTYATFSPDQEPAMRKVLDAFEDENPGISVEVQVIPFGDYWTTLQTATAGGTGPDVAWMLGAKVGQYVDGGVLLPLDDAIDEAAVDRSAYPEQLVDLFTRDDVTYALPKDFDTIGLWYNKELFDAAGLEYPDDSWTWDDVVTAAQAITDPAKDVYGIAAPIDAQAGYYNTIYQAGGEVISEDGTTSGYDDPATIAGIQFWTDMVNKYHVSPTLASLSDTEAVAQFMSGRIGMFYSGSFYAIRFANDEYTSKNVDVAKLPRGKQDASIINGLGNVALASTKHPEEATKLAVFLSGKEASQIQSETGAVLGSYDGTQQAWVDAFPQFDAQVFLDQVPNSVVLPVSENTDAWASRESELLTPAWTGDKTAAEAATELAKVMNDALAQENAG